MLENTFCHIPRVSARKELEFWERGFRSWEDVLCDNEFSIPRVKRDHAFRFIEESVRKLEAKDPLYFAKLLPSKEHWRLFPEFRDSMAYIDIETTGMDQWEHEITTVALYDGREVHSYVRGENLQEFKRDIKNYKVLVSYNGKSFDVPFLQNYFQMRLDHAHIDLMHVLRSLGYRGGLKSCERQMGIERHELAGVSGMMAVLLWHEYEKRNNKRALETLISYNVQDVLSLEILLAMAYNLTILDTPFHVSRKQEIPIPPSVPYQADLETLERLRGEYQGVWE